MEYSIKERISKGSFGTIFKVVHRSTNKEYALKQVPLEHASRAEKQEAIDEARILSKLDHPYIIKHYLSFIEDNTLHIIMELASAGTLFHLRNGPRLAEDRIWKYCIQMLVALDYIHSKKIIHRDIKTLNLMLDGDDNVKLGDFGIARSQSSGTNMLRTLVGTPFYLSPELCDDKPYNSAADIWSMGVCLYELCMGKHPYTAQNEGALIRKIMRGDYERPTGYSRDLLGVVMACLAYDHKIRPSAATLLARPAVNKKAHDLNILPLKLEQRRSVEQHIKAHSEQSVVMEPVRNAIHDNMPPAAPKPMLAQEQHPFAREASGDKVIQGVKTSVTGDAQPVNDGLPSSAHRQDSRGANDNAVSGLNQPVQAEQIHPNIQDNVQHLMKMSLSVSESPRKAGRLLPADLPPAGARCNRTRDSLPYAKDGAWMSQEAKPDSGVWNHQYERPQFARKRSQDLMVTGPNPRAATAPTSGKPIKAAGYYAYEGSVNTSTSYMQGSRS